MEAKQIPVTTNDFTIAMERLRAANGRTDSGTGTPLRVEQVRNQGDGPAGTDTGTGTGSGTGPPPELAQKRIGQVIVALKSDHGCQ